MTFPISPGVYSIETNESVIVPSVATSVGAIVIQSNKGPVNTPTLITSNKQFLDTFGTPQTDKPSMYAALAFLERANRLWVVRASTDATVASATAQDAGAEPADTISFSAANAGAWGNDLSVTFEDKNPTDNIFKVLVWVKNTLVETWTVSKEQALDGFGKSLFIEDVINNNSAYIRASNVAANTALPDMNAIISLSGGLNDTTAVTDAEVLAAWDVFANKDQYEVTLLINGGFASPAVQQRLIAIAEHRTDAFAILDMPSAENSVEDMVTYVETDLNANTSYGAIYAGWPQIYDQYNDKTLFVPPSGHVAGVYAYTQAVAEPWAAPAGARRGILNVLGVNRVFSEGERDALYEANINPIQMFVGEGVQVYGQKTLSQMPSALDRVNVRMLLITIQKAITRALRPFVFEANDAYTRENVTSIIRSYMEDIRSRRGVYDFKVVADGSINTGQVIDQNKLLINLYVKPTRTAEFVRLNTIVTATGVSFSS